MSMAMSYLGICDPEGAMNMCARAREMRVEKYLVVTLAALDTAECMLGMQFGCLHNGSDIE
jgi:hypothetical protein